MLTEYQPRPEHTDSEYNDLKAAYVARGVSIDALLDQLNERQAALDESTATASRLRVENAQLQAQLDNLNAHIEADHDYLKNTLGGGGLVTAHTGPRFPLVIQTLHAALTDIRKAADDPYEAANDEDSVEYQFPEPPKTIDS